MKEEINIGCILGGSEKLSDTYVAEYIIPFAPKKKIFLKFTYHDENKEKNGFSKSKHSIRDLINEEILINKIKESPYSNEISDLIIFPTLINCIVEKENIPLISFSTDKNRVIGDLSNGFRQYIPINKYHYFNLEDVKYNLNKYIDIDSLYLRIYEYVEIESLNPRNIKKIIHAIKKLNSVLVNLGYYCFFNIHDIFVSKDGRIYISDLSNNGLIDPCYPFSINKINESHNEFLTSLEVIL